tara:strand:- start:2771 stop:2971 length:201 start_codon:yes stop_codon:yes gene_type:complete
MPVKLKPSSKDYIKDANGRMTNRFQWKHYTVSNTSTEDLKKYYTSSTMTKKKNVIKRELDRRGISL